MKAIGKKGFTVIELMVVFAILFILAALAVPQVIKAIESSKIATDQANVKTLNTMTAIYRSTDPLVDPFVNQTKSNTELIQHLVDNGYLSYFVEPKSKDTSFQWLFNEKKWVLSTERSSYVVISTDGLIIVITGGHIGYLKGDYNNQDSLDIIIPVSLDGQVIKNIWQDVFKNKGIESITFAQASQIIQIHARAFYSNNISSIVLPDTIEKIDLWAYKDNNLTEIRLPSS